MELTTHQAMPLQQVVQMVATLTQHREAVTQAPQVTFLILPQPMLALPEAIILIQVPAVVTSLRHIIHQPEPAIPHPPTLTLPQAADILLQHIRLRRHHITVLLVVVVVTHPQHHITHHLITHIQHQVVAIPTQHQIPPTHILHQVIHRMYIQLHQLVVISIHHQAMDHLPQLMPHLHTQLLRLMVHLNIPLPHHMERLLTEHHHWVYPHKEAYLIRYWIG